MPAGEPMPHPAPLPALPVCLAPLALLPALPVCLAPLALLSALPVCLRLPHLFPSPTTVSVLAPPPYQPYLCVYGPKSLIQTLLVCLPYPARLPALTVSGPISLLPALPERLP
jgi:hypothetical protein